MRNLKMKIARMTSNVTQDQIASRLGVDVSKVSRIENGFIEPNEREKQVIAELLNADLKALFPEN